MSARRRLSLLALCVLIAGCNAVPTMPTAQNVDIERFMGDWYVIANIPTFLEVDAYNAVESYKLDADGSIATTFRFRKGSFDAPEKVMRPRGFVRDRESNAVWGMQFVWPIKSEYLIAHVDPEYRETIIGRSKRDYVWIMARTPTIPPEDFARLEAKVAALGYDTSKLRKVPQRWDGADRRPTASQGEPAR